MVSSPQFEVQAQEMVENQLRARGITDGRVLDAMRAVPRHEFVPRDFLGAAYSDRPLPIGAHATISQPYIVAAMTQAAQIAQGDNVLEIGGGCGYQAAVLAQLGANVRTVEINPRLAAEARARLERLGYKNIEVFAGDGSEGLAVHAPYDAIIVSAATPNVSPVLVEQLAETGRLVAPVGSLRSQQISVVCRQNGQITIHRLDPCQFVPLVGKGGWQDQGCDD